MYVYALLQTQINCIHLFVVENVCADGTLFLVYVFMKRVELALSILPLRKVMSRLCSFSWIKEQRSKPGTA